MAVDYAARIAALEDALAQGVLSVSYEGKSASYRSFAEMMQVLAYFRRQLAKAAGLKTSNVGLATFDRGYHHRGRRC